jgi:hypothetical protein
MDDNPPGEGMMIANSNNPGNLLKRYFFWTYERGSLHYDIMVTLILLFMFVTPHFIDFKAAPVETLAKHPSEVLVKEAGLVGSSAQFEYTIRADALGSGGRASASDADRRSALLKAIEPISGEVTLERYEEVKDASGQVVAYNAWVLR